MPPAQMFALCGVMIIVGIVYIRNAPRPVPAEPVAIVAASSAGLATAVPNTAEVADVAPGAPTTRSTSLDAPARDAAAEASVPLDPPATAVPTPGEPTSTAGVTIAISSDADATPPAPVSTVALTTTTTALSITLSATPLAPVAGAPTTTTTTTTPTTYANRDSGVASWFNAPDNTCAHLTLPFGTMVKVTRVHNGAVAFCKVNDRGPTLETGRLIDLSKDTFEKLAPAEVGLIDVVIEW